MDMGLLKYKRELPKAKHPGQPGRKGKRAMRRILERIRGPVGGGAMYRLECGHVVKERTHQKSMQPKKVHCPTCFQLEAKS